MIKVKMKDGSVKIKAKGNKGFVVREIAFAVAGCINEICDGPGDFEKTKDKVIDLINKIHLSDDEESFEIGE